jgi:hypothetical protein
MAHPFQDKLFAFIGEPERCKIRAARDALDAVGGVVDDRIKSFTSYVVEFRHNEKTDKYKRAVADNEKGYLILLNEEQFFDILEGRAEPPPKKKNPREGVIISLPLDPEAAAREHERTWQDILNRKRLINLAKYGVPTPDGGRLKADLRHLDKASRVIEMMRKGTGTVIRGSESLSDHCDNCGNPVRVHIGDGKGGEVANLCLDCYNRLMAETTGTDMSEVLPKRLSFKGRDRKTYEFEIELMYFVNGKSLTATEIGKTKRKADVHGELEDDLGEMLETLKRRIKKVLSVKYMEPSGYVSKGKAVGYIEYNCELERHEIIIDGKPYTWAELEKNISAHEGWKIKIEFGDVGDELD